MANMLRRLAGAIPELVNDAVGLAGAGAISFGAWQVYPPAGWMIGGGLLLAGALLYPRASA